MNSHDYLINRITNFISNEVVLKNLNPSKKLSIIIKTDYFVVTKVFGKYKCFFYHAGFI